MYRRKTYEHYRLSSQYTDCTNTYHTLFYFIFLFGTRKNCHDSGINLLCIFLKLKFKDVFNLLKIVHMKKDLGCTYGRSQCLLHFYWCNWLPTSFFLQISCNLQKTLALSMKQVYFHWIAVTPFGVQNYIFGLYSLINYLSSYLKISCSWKQIPQVSRDSYRKV
jgi:hypothetical protein